MRCFWVRLLQPAIFVTVTSCTCSWLGKSEVPVRIGLNAWPGYEFLSLAHTKGFFAEQGVKTELVEFSSLADARRAMEKNQIDVLGTTMFELVLARHNSEAQLRAFYVVDYSNGGDLVIGAPGVAGMADLRGKKVGVEVGSVSLYALMRGLSLSGLALADVGIVSVAQETMASEFGAGAYAAAVTYHPFSLKMLEVAGARVIFSSQEIPGEIVDVLAASNGFLEQHPKLARGIVKGFVRAVEYAHTAGTDGMSIMAAREKISEQEFRRMLASDMALVPFDEQAAQYFKSGKLQDLAHRVEKALADAGQNRSSGRLEQIAQWMF